MNPDKIRAALPRASKGFLALNGLDGSKPFTPAIVNAPKKEDPIRQRRGGKSKLQQAFLDWIKDRNKDSFYDSILDEALTLSLGNGVTYRADVVAVRKIAAGVQLFAYEVKGPHFWAAAKIKLKIAARSFPWIEFYLVTRPERLGPWKIVAVEP